MWKTLSSCFYLRLKGHQWYPCGDLTKPHTRSDDNCELRGSAWHHLVWCQIDMEIFILENKALFACMFFSAENVIFSTSIEFVSFYIIPNQYEKLVSLDWLFFPNMYFLFKNKMWFYNLPVWRHRSYIIRYSLGFFLYTLDIIFVSREYQTPVKDANIIWIQNHCWWLTCTLRACINKIFQYDTIFWDAISDILD